MKGNTIRKKLDKINEILKEVQDEVNSLDFPSVRRELENVARICDEIFLECEKIQLEFKDDYHIIPTQRYVSSRWFHYSEGIKEQIQKTIDQYTPIKLSIDEVKDIQGVTYVYFTIQ